MRDAACVACGRCAANFPDDMRPTLPTLWGLWESTLDNNIFSVRESAAIALGDAVRGLGDEAVGHVEDILRYDLPMLQVVSDKFNQQAPVKGVDMKEVPSTLAYNVNCC